MVKFELSPLHWQPKSLITCLPTLILGNTNNQVSKSNTSSNTVGQTTEEVRSHEEPTESCSDGIFCGQSAGRD